MQFLGKIALFGVATIALVSGLMMVAGYDVQYSSGSSMKPTLHDGSIVVYHEGTSPEVGDIAVYEDEDGSNIVHRVVEIREDGPVLKGDNNDYPDARREWSQSKERDITAPPDRVHKVAFVLYDGAGVPAAIRWLLLLAASVIGAISMVLLGVMIHEAATPDRRVR